MPSPRPPRTSPPECGRSHAGKTCRKKGDHRCNPRVEHAVGFFNELLVHTKGDFARQAFDLRPWQRKDVIAPLFGNVVFSEERQRYVRQYKTGWIEVARKNGKSELLAGIALYMLTADGEWGAEVYGAAKTRDQARIVWDTAARMVAMSPHLSKILVVKNHEKRIVYTDTGSFYAVLAADANANLGLNPHCVVFDEIISQRDGNLWNALRTAMGARAEAMMVAATTAGDDMSSFAAIEHAECVRVDDDPERAPHRFVYIKNVPMDADPWDEKLWKNANPALGDFLSMQSLRDEAQEARNDPSKENAFRQFRLNQWVSQSTRWMPMYLYDECVGDIWPNNDWRAKELEGREAWVGIDLAAKHDLTAAAILLPSKDGVSPADVIYKFYCPEDAFKTINAVSNLQALEWVRDGWLTVHEGSVLDHRAVVHDLVETLKPFKVREITYDKWSGDFIRLEFEDHYGKSVPLVANEPGFGGMTVPMNELMNLTTAQGWYHHGNPIARWCFDAVETVKSTSNPDLIRPSKPVRNTANRRIDGVVATALAVGAWKVRGAIKVKPRRAYGF